MTDSAASNLSHSPDDDRKTLAAIARGDALAFGRLYDRYSSIMFGLCLRILKDRMVAEETLEDVFWELWKRADRYDPSRGNPVAYVMNLTQSRAIDRLRARVRRQRLQPMVDGAAYEMASSLRLADNATPLEDCLQLEQRDRIKVALQRLSLEQRSVVELAYFEGLTHVEIAEKLAQPLGTVKTRIRQGLVHLRESLRAEFGVGENYPGEKPIVQTEGLPEQQRDLA